MHAMSLEPLVIEFELSVPPAAAFAVWTERCATWWPRAHTISGDPSAITFEPRPGGQIVEHADGEEHPWGTVLDWEPPRRVRYLWHLFFTPSEATEVEVTFVGRGAHTAVRLEQRGWDRLGHAAAARREKTGRVWLTLASALGDAVRAAPGGL
jgi:uncharacterized protein YndB with AHSA1/START domain